MKKKPERTIILIRRVRKYGHCSETGLSSYYANYFKRDVPPIILFAVRTDDANNIKKKKIAKHFVFDADKTRPNGNGRKIFRI